MEYPKENAFLCFRLNFLKRFADFEHIPCADRQK